MDYRRTLFVSLVILAVIVLSSLAVFFPGLNLRKNSSSDTGFSSADLVTLGDHHVPVGVFYYLWYGNSTFGQNGLGYGGWNSSSSPGGGSVVDYPMVGYYASDSNQTFSWQISQMQNAGISLAVVSWWGPYTNGESGLINKATHDLFEFLKETNSSFQIALMVDANRLLVNNQSASTYQWIYNYVNDEFASPYAQWYFNFNGKPLLLFFNPLYPTYLNSSFTTRTIGNRPNPVNWTWWDAPTQYFVSQYGPHVNASNDEGNPVISWDGEVTIVPRIDLYYQYRFGYFDSFLRFDPDLSMGLYREQWSYVLNHSSSVHLILIYSWNEYHERSEIEPHYDPSNSNLSPYYLPILTKSYISMLDG
jgi:hypothetical protein